MTLNEILLGGGGGALLLLTLLEIAPIKVNPWSWLAKTIGNAFSHDVIAELKAQRVTLDSITEDNADSSRQKILEFNDRLLHKEKHSKEYFDSILHTIDKYEDYCETHPKYKNNKALLAIENIKEVYKTLSKEGGFL